MTTPPQAPKMTAPTPASPLPYHVEHDDSGGVSMLVIHSCDDEAEWIVYIGPDDCDDAKRDAAYIVHACNAYPELVEERDQLLGDVAAAKMQRDVAQGCNAEADADCDGWLLRADADSKKLRATIATLQAQVKKRDEGTAAVALVAAIRRQTVEAPNDEPNGLTESHFLELRACLEAGNLQRARQAYRYLATTMADDTQALREAAEGYFGGDFRAPDPEGQ